MAAIYGISRKILSIIPTDKKSKMRKWKMRCMMSKKRREGESKYVAIHLLCTANSRKMLKISLVESFCQRNQFHFRDDDRNHPTANTDDHHSKQHTHRKREKKLIVFIVSSNLLMSKIGASKENQIKKVPFSLLKCM